VSVDLNSAKHSNASSALKPRKRAQTVSLPSLKCKTVSGISFIYSVDSSAHPELYAPIDALEEDELDSPSTDAPETATKQGDEKLSESKREEDKKETKNKEVEGKKKGDKKGDIRLQGSGGKKPKQGDERKNESVIARSG
jgi:hypothetical protein